MLRRRFPHGTRLLALVALLAALVVAGCGGEDEATGGGSPDPAAATPADAFAYGELVVRPSGDVETDASAALRKVLRVDDPGAELRRLVDKLLTEGGSELTWARDAEPWIGDRIAFFATPPTDGEDQPEWAAIAAVRDAEAYDEAVERWRDEGLFRPAGTYGGVAYDVYAESDPSTSTVPMGGFSARVGDFSVTGSETGLRAAIDADGGDSLADAARFEDAVDEADDDALAFLYVDPQVLARAADAADELPPSARASFERFAQSDPIVASLTATADEIAFEATADNTIADVATAGDSDAEVTVGQLPGDAWFALATPPLGPLIEQVLDTAGFRREAAREVRQALGLELGRDLLDPLGGLGLFARGSNPLDLGGGVLLQLTDSAAAERLMTRIQALVGAGLGVPPRSIELGGARGFEVAIPQSPQPIVVVQQDDRIAAGYAASSARDLLAPQQRFDESSAGKAAIATLGEGFEPSFVVIVPPIARLLRALDQLQVAELSEVVSYLDAYTSLAVGTERDDDETTVRVVAALR